VSTDPGTDLDRRLRAWVEERDFSGAVLVTRGGETVFEECYGYADKATRAPITPATRFALASITKMFTAVAVVDLVAAGRLTFETPVVSVLPEERRPSTLLPSVTVHHLLCHTSGITDYCEEEEDYPNFLEDYGSLWEQLPSYSMERPADFLPLFGDLPPYREPGLQWQYSNAGYIVLGLVIEEVTGRPYTEVVQERVFDRAGMTASGFFRLDEVVPDVAVGYLPRASREAPWRSNIYRVPVIGGADGGSHSTTHDLATFLRACDDGSLLGPLRDTVLTHHADAGHGFAMGYGLLFYPDGRFGHGGGDPGVSTIANRWPDQDVNVVVLCNVEDPASDVRDEVLASLGLAST
jgi:CubicO group peptidase (beta-lactamase class C family)